MIPFLKKQRYSVIAVVVILLVSLYLSTRASKNDVTVVPHVGDLVRTVELSGKVIPQTEVDLAFETGGTVLTSGKKVGDSVYAGEVLVGLDSSRLEADYLKAQADLNAAQAELDKLEGGASLQAKVSSSRATIVQKILNAYSSADDAIHAKVDQFFRDPRSPNPRIITAFYDNENLGKKIDTKRVAVEDAFDNWIVLISGLSSVTYDEKILDASRTYLREMVSFADLVSIAVNKFEVNSDLTQTTIDKYRSDVSSARSSLNESLLGLIAGEETLTDTVADVPVQIAKVAAAEANLASITSQLSKMVLRSPITGVISKQDAKIGESLSANTNVVSVISTDYKIEAYVPEVSVAGIALGAKAKVTLDAYGDEAHFDAKIAHIDPRETIRDGVSTYKLELVFDVADPRIRSGMTANIVVETMRKENVLLIPLRSVITKDGISTVQVKQGDDVVVKTVKVGVRDSKGDVEVLDGVTAEDVLLLNPVQ